MTDDKKIFNSEKNKGSETFELATGHISSTTVFFEEEGVYVKIEAKGLIEFFDREERLVSSVTLPAQTGGKEVYDQVECSARDGVITLRFFVVEWIDNYPHCDGEHDRWDSRIIGCHKLTYNTATKEHSIN